MEEKFISDMMDNNAVLDPSTGDLLELLQLLKTPEAKLCRDVEINNLSRLAKVIKKRTIKGQPPKRKYKYSIHRGLTPLQSDNKCAHGIIIVVIKQE